MKVLALGGSGGMGGAQVRASLTLISITEIICGGLMATIERFVASLK